MRARARGGRRVSVGNPPHQLGAVASFLKLTARRGGTDFRAETIAAAMDGSGHSIALIADLLAALKAAGHYDAPDRLARRAGQHFTPTLASGVNVR